MTTFHAELSDVEAFVTLWVFWTLLVLLVVRCTHLIAEFILSIWEDFHDPHHQDPSGHQR